MFSTRLTPESILVFDRKRAAKYSYHVHEHTSIVISITDVGSRPASIYRHQNGNQICVVLRLQFDDVLEDDGNAMTMEQARTIARVIANQGQSQTQVDRIVIQCEAGLSRSAAVAAAIAEWAGVEDAVAIYEAVGKTPNPHVLNLMRKAFTKAPVFKAGKPLKESIQ